MEGGEKGDVEGEQMEGEVSACVLGRGGMGGRAGGRRAVLRILPDIWKEF